MGPSPFAEFGADEARPRTAVERVRLIRESHRQRNLLALGRIALLIGSLGLVLAVLTLSALLAPTSGLLPGYAEEDAANLSPEGKHTVVVVMGPIQIALGLAGLACAGPSLRGCRGFSRAGAIVAAIAGGASLLALAGGVLLFFVA